jgi:hypothetical protein
MPTIQTYTISKLTKTFKFYVNFFLEKFRCLCELSASGHNSIASGLTHLQSVNLVSASGLRFVNSRWNRAVLFFMILLRDIQFTHVQCSEVQL